MNKKKSCLSTLLLLCMFLATSTQVKASQLTDAMTEETIIQAQTSESTTKSTQNNDLLEDGQSLEDTTTTEGSSQDLSQEEDLVQVLTENYQDTSLTTTVFSGLHAQDDTYIYVEDYWEIGYAYLALQYQVSPLLEDGNATLTVTVNDDPVDSVPVNGENSEMQMVYIKIPANRLQEGYNLLEISTYMHQEDVTSCTDSFDESDWITIEEESYVRIGYDIKDIEASIENYPYPFVSTVYPSGQGLTLCVSDEAEDEEIAAALMLMADLSSEISSDNDIQMTFISSLMSTQPTRTIVVSLYSNLPADYQKLVSEPENQTILFLTEDKKGNPLLLLTSDQLSGLMKGVNLLLDDDRVVQIHSTKTYLSTEVDEPNDTDSGRTYTLEDLEGGDLDFEGAFHQEASVFLPFSETYILGQGAKVDLKFRYSDNLDFDRSLMTVYWGDIPVYSHKLTQEDAQDDSVSFAMPQDVVGVEAGQIQITFDLEIEDLICTPRQGEMPWAHVSKTSSFYLPTTTSQDLSFDVKPFPFRSDGKFNDLLMVVDNQVTATDLQLYGQIIAKFGEDISPYGEFSVKRVEEMDTSDEVLMNANIIAVGTPDNNTFVSTLNDYLSFKYNEDKTGLVSNEEVILDDTYASQVASLQLIESPYSIGRGILVVSAPEESGMERVEDFLRLKTASDDLAGDCVLLDLRLDTSTYSFLSTNIAQEQATPLELIVTNKQSLLLTIIATSVMLMIFLAVLILLLRIRMYQRKIEQQEKGEE